MRGLAEPLCHKDAVVAGLLAAAGLDKAEPGVERDVFDHLLVRVEPQFRVTEPLRLAFRKCDHPAAITLSSAIRAYCDIVEQQMIGLRYQDDDRSDLEVFIFNDADQALHDQRPVIVKRRTWRFVHALEVDRIGILDDALDRGAVSGICRADHGSGTSITSPSCPGSIP